MYLPENDYQILKLTDAFFQAYPNPPYIEILKKKERAYNCLLFQTHYNYCICIPFRSEISHLYAYHFKKSKRSKKHKSGLDYSKIVIVKNLEYIGTQNAIIDHDEFKETMRHMERIKKESLKFVEDYVAHMDKRQLLPEKEFKRRYTYSTLKYFHDELGVKEK
ncbi:type III toxin-antitoxin system TenpIN family toxin [Blautia sp. HCP3S3_H10_1]|uniref:type III toxin-antitoxin system TenpIN family toxin n=1 Tax=unclassified Blautia TaxID=2648079 RepID=UPI003F8E39DF|nr:hypothetical protein [Clostridia bacterium]